jgi:hypothetical protein
MIEIEKRAAKAAGIPDKVPNGHALDNDPVN